MEEAHAWLAEECAKEQGIYEQELEFRHSEPPNIRGLANFGLQRHQRHDLHPDIHSFLDNRPDVLACLQDLARRRHTDASAMEQCQHCRISDPVQGNNGLGESLGKHLKVI